MKKPKFTKRSLGKHPSDIVLVIAAVVFTTLFVSNDLMWRKQIQSNLPLYDNITQLRVSLTKAHLMLESILAGDRSIRPEDIWPLFDTAEIALKDSISGRSTIANLPGDHHGDKEIVPQLRELEGTIKQLRNIAEQRWDARNTSATSKTLEERSLFYEAEGVIEVIDYYALQNISTMMDYQKQARVWILVIWLTIVLGTSMILFVDRKKRLHAERQLQKTLNELESTVEERTKELTATNGRLSAEITDRKQAEQTLKDRENRFRLAVENAPFPIMLHSEDGEVLTISKGWTDSSGFTLTDIPTTADWTEQAYGAFERISLGSR